MERNWYLRVALILGVFLFSVYQLVPSWFYFRLPPDQRAALVLSDVLEFPLTEVADILDCDVTEVGRLLVRARAAIDVPQRECADCGPTARQDDPGGGVAAFPVIDLELPRLMAFAPLTGK